MEKKMWIRLIVAMLRKANVGQIRGIYFFVKSYLNLESHRA